MPNIPQMSVFWYAERSAVKNAINGKQTVQEALDGVKARLIK